jgi:hypothetical protein
LTDECGPLDLLRIQEGQQVAGKMSDEKLCLGTSGACNATMTECDDAKTAV